MLWVEVYLCFPFNHQITERNHRKLSDDKVRKLPKEDCFFFFGTAQAVDGTAFVGLHFC